MSGPPWFKCFPSDFLNGVLDLTPDELAVYTVCIMRMYDEGKPIPDDAERIARRVNMRMTTCKKVLNSLCDAGKLTRRDGVLTNIRVEKENKSRQELSQKSATNARARWEKSPEKSTKTTPDPCNRNATAPEPHMPTRSQKLEARSQKEVVGSADAALKVFDGGVAFSGRTFRVSHDDLASWQKSYKHIPDLQAELQAADDYYSEHPPADGKIFFRVSRWLAKGNVEWKDRGDEMRKSESRRKGYSF